MGKKENYDFFSSRIIKVIGKRGEEESVKRKGREETERDVTFQLIPCVCVITYIYIYMDHRKSGFGNLPFPL